MIYTYKIPKKVKNEDVEQETNLMGEIKISVPGYKAAVKLATDLRFKLNEKGESVALNNEDMAEKIIDLVPQHVKEFKVSSLDNSIVFENIEDLGACKEGKLILGELVKIILGGFPLSKK